MSESRWRCLAIGSSVVFAAFATVHLIDDFLFDIPQEFNLSIPLTQVLTLAFMVGLVGLIAFSAAGSKEGFLGLSIAGSLIALSQILKSVPEMMQPGIWRSGIHSQIYSLGLLLAAVVTSLAGIQVWRKSG